jgi:hypothetical protein
MKLVQKLERVEETAAKPISGPPRDHIDRPRLASFSSLSSRGRSSPLLYVRRLIISLQAALFDALFQKSQPD